MSQREESEDSPPENLLIVGLGNPGKEYEQTRHNAGFLAVDEFSRRLRADSSWKEKFQGVFTTQNASGGKIILLKPMTYMNESGVSVQQAAKFFKIPPTDVCIVHDDMDHPLGTVRLKRGGGDGGHNGLKSVSKHLSKRNYLRLRFGIGRPNIPQEADISRDFVHSWVLGKFSEEERSRLREALERASSALEALLHDGFEKAQNVVNKRNAK